MPELKESVVIKQSIDTVYKAIKSFSFSKFASSIKGVELIKREGNKATTQWIVDFDGSPFRWMQEDVFDDENKIIVFRMTEGDFHIYTGEWRLKALDLDRVKVEITAYFNWGVPNLEKYVGAMFSRKARKALKGLLLSIKKNMERTEK